MASGTAVITSRTSALRRRWPRVTPTSLTRWTSRRWPRRSFIAIETMSTGLPWFGWVFVGSRISMEGHCETDTCGLSVDPQHLARRNRNDDFIDREGGVGARLADWNAWWGKSPRSDRRAFFQRSYLHSLPLSQARSANRSSPMLCIRAICRMHPLRSAPTAATYRCSPMPSKNSISPPVTLADHKSPPPRRSFGREASNASAQGRI